MMNTRVWLALHGGGLRSGVALVLCSSTCEESAAAVDVGRVRGLARSSRVSALTSTETSSKSQKL